MTRVLSLAALAALLSTGAAAQSLTPEQQLEFLRTAEIVASAPIGKGVTRPFRLTLRNGTLTHDAAFQSIDDRSSERERREGIRRAGETAFVDAYRYNLAAYRLAVLLGLGHMIPVTVERRWNGRRGALTWWVDDVLMDEAAREEKDVQPPDPRDVNYQRQRMTVFAELVRDTDRNKGNVLYTRAWKVVMIDFTRAFRLQPELRVPQSLQICDRALLEALRALTKPAVAKAVDDALTAYEIDAVLARSALIVARYDQLIRERGAAAVLY
jgi:hypothetical protein